MNRHRITCNFLAAILLLFVVACGGGVVELDHRNYQPKIVIEGFIFPERPVKNIRITRNFPLNQQIDPQTLILRDAEVRIRTQQGREHRLQYNQDQLAFAYLGQDLRIEAGRSYTLFVTADIDGQRLQAWATTRVPEKGLRIDRLLSELGPLAYRERSPAGSLRRFNLVFHRSPGTDFYVVALTALQADLASFIYENPFETYEAEAVLADFGNLQNRIAWVHNTPLEPGLSNIELFWFDFWFYGDYRAVLYAGDRNFRDFILTQAQVQEIDGNFHLPALHVEGDGIGVFASAITDTVILTVRR